MSEVVYDWSVPGGPPLVMTDNDVNMAVRFHAQHSYNTVEIYTNMVYRNPDRNPEYVYRLAQASAMTASIVTVMGWGSASDPHLSHIRPDNEEWMLFVADLVERAGQLEAALAQGGYGG